MLNWCMVERDATEKVQATLSKGPFTLAIFLKRVILCV